MSFVAYVQKLSENGQQLSPLPSGEHCIKNFYSSITGDINNDKIVDRNDVVAFKPFLRQPATACPECDLDGDGTITILDARRLALLAK